MRYNLIVLLALFTKIATAQSVSGIVTDTEKQPVEFATISLLKPADSSLVTGGVSDLKGKFHLKQLAADNYVLTVRFLGYRTYKSSITLKNGQNLNIGTVQLQSNARTLDAVNITATKAAASHKIDKQVFSAGQFQSSVGGTALDIVKNTPSVTVNSEGDVALRGSTGLLVLLNGKPVQASPKELLSQLPANTIENIEIITAPSAKYDPDGKSGIINIVTKKGTANGTSLIANVQGGLPSVQSYNNLNAPQRYGADATANLRNKQWDFTLAGSYLRNDLAGRREGDVNTIINGVKTSFPSNGERSFKRFNHTARLAVTYTPDKSNSISVGFYNGRKTQYRRADILYNNTRSNASNGQVISQFTYFNENLVKKLGDFTLGNIDYTHSFSNKSSLTLSGLYEHGRVDAITTNYNQQYPARNIAIENVENNGRNPLDAFRVKADYSIPIGKGKLESGYQYRYQQQNGVFTYERENLTNGIDEIVPEFSSSADLKNEIHSVYSQYSGKVSKLEYVTGLRYEYATRKFVGKDAKSYNLDLSNFFPSVNLLYAAKSNLKFKAGYSTRVQRSTNNELNPLPEREHSETLEQGDPTIRPEFVNLAELGLIKDFKSGSVYITLYNQRIKNVINRVNSVYNDTVLNRIFTNAGKANLWGAELGTNLKPVKWYQLYVGTNIYDYSIKGSLFNNAVQVNSSSWVYSINTNSNIQLAKTLSFQWSINYLSKRVTAQGEDSRYVIPSSSLKKNFWKNKASLTLQWQNMDLGIFDTNEQRISTWGSNFYTTTNYIQEKDLLLLNLSISLNQLTKKLKLPASEFGEKEF